ncbi:MAG: DeoR/GlpR family DNA-binding transcription regulator, partial [Bacillota bacterium]
LSEYFGISDVSVRKLLIVMEEEFLLKRTWGGAIKPIGTMKELTYQARETKNLSEKVAIAQMAYDCINEGDSIYVDSGTTTFELVKQIKGGPKKNILLATNALDHAIELIGQPNVNIVLIGGEVRQDVRSCSGYLTKDTISQMVFDKCFVGIEHISIEHGITTPNMREAELKRTIIKSSKQAFVLADYSKFWNDSLIQIAPTEKYLRVITDWHISQGEIDQFQSKGISIIVAPQSLTV